MPSLDGGYYNKLLCIPYTTTCSTYDTKNYSQLCLYIVFIIHRDIQSFLIHRKSYVIRKAKTIYNCITLNGWSIHQGQLLQGVGDQGHNFVSGEPSHGATGVTT